MQSGLVPSVAVGAACEAMPVPGVGLPPTQSCPAFAAAKAGQLWVGGNPTPGTGIASHAAPTATDGTKPLCMFKNNYAVGTGKNIYLERVKLAVTAAGTNA